MILVNCVAFKMVNVYQLLTSQSLFFIFQWSSKPFIVWWSTCRIAMWCHWIVFLSFVDGTYSLKQIPFEVNLPVKYSLQLSFSNGCVQTWSCKLPWSVNFRMWFRACAYIHSCENWVSCMLFESPFFFHVVSIQSTLKLYSCASNENCLNLVI
jgi:hypothetical protein